MKRLILLVTALLCFMLPATAMAYNPLSDACGSGGGATSSAACGTTGKDPISGSNGILEKTTIILSTIAGIVAVIVILVGGFLYVTSGGNPQRIEGARNAIIGALVGLVIIAAAASLITFVVGKI
jgi:hypothetical protein